MGIFDKRITIATHYLVYGAPQALRDYLINNKAKNLLFLAHPLSSHKDRSCYELIKNGQTKKKIVFPLRTRVSLANYIIEFCLTLFWVFSSREKQDLFIGVDNLNTMAGLTLRVLGKVDKVIYYTIDYSPRRFKNGLLNYIYHKIDALCVKYSDIVWNVSPRIAEGRKKIKGINFTEKQRVVPIGVWFNKIKRRPFDKIKRHQLLFLGHLLEKQGVQIVIDAIPVIAKKVPNFHFLIIGGGEYEKALGEKVKKMKLDKQVTFTGWIKDRKRIDNLISESACAIAPYDPRKAGFTYYADPTKIKDYLSAGLPVILTNVPYNAKEVEEKKCGIVINYNKKDVANSIIEIMSNKKKLKDYRKNALKYIQEFDWNKIFSKYLKEYND